MTAVADPGASAQALQVSRFVVRLVWIGLFLAIWNRTLPALSMLRQVTLTAQGLTLLQAFQALAAGLATLILVRNIPGVIQVLLVPSSRVHVGTVYAVATVARYGLVLGGSILVSGILGLEWGRIQWLAAALTFGIGFGLQEVFANLASGLILLLDRSVRVGDAVTVGEWSGRVSRIQMRATTVTLWNRSEMVVPNKEFISSKLINWTLSLPESRVDIRTAVAYGSDLDLVRRILQTTALDNPNVLRTPAPVVLLTRFGENAVVFELQAFCLYEFGRNTLIDQLHTAIYNAFTLHGIRIAAPRLRVEMENTVVADVDLDMHD
jgi:small-conductance mechanosensitive channel